MPARTIREYIARGLLEGTPDRGPGASYPVEDLDRLRFVQRLRAEFGLPLDAIRGVMGQLDHAQIRRVGNGEEKVIALPLTGGEVEAVERTRNRSGQQPEGETEMLKITRLSDHHRGSTEPLLELKRVGVAEMEEALASALESLTDGRYVVLIDRVDFGSRRFGSVRAGAATMQIDVIRKAPEDSLFGEDAE